MAGLKRISNETKTDEYATDRQGGRLTVYF